MNLKLIIKKIIPSVILKYKNAIVNAIRNSSIVTFDGIYKSFNEVNKVHKVSGNYDSQESVDYNLTIVRKSLNRFDNNESPYLDLSLSRYNILPLFISGINRKYISVLDIGGGGGELSSLHIFII